MSSQLKQNTADLQEILDTVNALPDAGSGGGGSVETCTVTVNAMYNMMSQCEIAYTTINSTGGVEFVENANFAYGTPINIVKNTIFTIYCYDAIDSTVLDGISQHSKYGNALIFIVNSSSDTATVTIYCSMSTNS